MNNYLVQMIHPSFRPVVVHDHDWFTVGVSDLSLPVPSGE